jgi:hypothetical protein
LGKTPLSLPGRTLDSGKTAEVSAKKTGFFIPTAPLFLCNARETGKTDTNMPKGGRIEVQVQDAVAEVRAEECGKSLASPNDPEISDCGARRGGCTAGGKAVVEAAAVTRGAVRCISWLGVMFQEVVLFAA